MSGGEPETVKRVVTHMSTATHSQELILDDKNLDMTSTTDLFDVTKRTESRYFSDNFEEIKRDDNKPGYFRKEGKKVQKLLFFEMKIKRISEIDTTNESFRARFHIYLTWLASQSEWEAFVECKKNKTYFIPKWTPDLTFANAISFGTASMDSSERPEYKIKYGAESGALNDKSWKIGEEVLGFKPWQGYWNRVKLEFDIRFAEEFELEAFPFDCQDLTLFLKVDGDTVKTADIVPFPRRSDFLMLDPEFSVLAEWDFEGLLCEFAKTDRIKSKSDKEYSLVSVRIKTSRRWEAHIGQMIVTVCMFTLGLGAFAQGLKGEELGNRLGYCVTLLLADVATLQLLFDNLPNIPYWTIFDFYIYACFVFLFAVTIWSCIGGVFLSDSDDDSADDLAFFVCLGFYTLAHVCFVIWSYYARRAERGKLRMTSQQLADFFKDTMIDRDRRAITIPWEPQDLPHDKENWGVYCMGKKKSSNNANEKISRQMSD